MSVNKKPTFSIIICSYNGAGQVPATIRSLRRLKYPKDQYEIIVVDDGSTDTTVKVAKRFKGVTVVSHEFNRGISAARNTGLKAARGRYIAYIDDDCTANVGWLQALEAQLKEPRTMAAGGLIAARSLGKITQRYLVASGYGRPAPIAVGAATSPLGRLAAYVKDKFASVRQKPDTTPSEVHEVYGANVAFAASKLRGIKGYNPQLNTSEDTDVCARLRERYPNHKVRFSPKAVVKHSYTASFKAYLRKLFVRQADTLTFYKQQHKMPPLYPFPPLVVLLALLGSLVSPWIGLATFVLSPLALYSWWTWSAVTSKKPEHLLYAYMEWLEESVRVLGLVRAALFKKSRSKPVDSAAPTALITKAESPADPIPAAVKIISKKHLFAGLLAWLAVFNLLQITQHPVQAAFAFLTLVLLPGLLLLLVLKVNFAGLRTWLYALGLSVVLLVVIALAADVAVIATNYRWRLSSGVFLIAVNVAMLTLLVAAWFRAKQSVQLPWAFSMRTILAVVAAAALPVAGALASLYLNKTDNNTASIAVLIAALGVFGVVLWRLKHLPHAAVALALYSVSLTIVLMGALRGTGVSGTDISKEFYLYDLVQQVGFWKPELYRDPYNACLTIHLLPSLIGDIMKVSGEFVYRVALPAIYASLPVMVYALYTRLTTKYIAYAGSLFFMIQPVFMKWSAIPIRQMMAFLFFAGLLLALFDKRLGNVARYTLMALFGVGVILSHYSTSYIMLGVLVCAFLLFRGKYLFDKHLRQLELSPLKPLITLPLLAGLIASALIWYGPVTHASGHALDLFKSGYKQFSDGNVNIFGSKAHSEQAGLLDQFNIAAAPRQPEDVWKDYTHETQRKYKKLNVTPLVQKSEAAPITPEAPEKMPYKTSPTVAKGLALGGQALSKITRIFLIVGLAILAYAFIRRRNTEHEFNLLAISSAIAIGLIIIIPNASIDYDISRTSQQLLALLSLPVVFGGIACLRFFTRHRFTDRTYATLIGVFILGTFPFISGLVPQLTGGQQPNMMLNNSGVQHEISVQPGETAAASWLADNRDDKSRTYSGYFGRNRLWTAGIDRASLYNDILPWTVDKHAYVYSSGMEVSKQQGLTYYNGSFVVYDYPTQLLTERKNIIYSNSQARIYK